MAHSPFPLPEGAQLLDADELALRLVTGDHKLTVPASWARSIQIAQMDTVLIDWVRAEALWAVLLPDGQLAFRPVEGHPLWAKQS